MRCILVERHQEGDSTTISAALQQRSEGDLPDGDVWIDVEWSSLNYKDALAATGNRGVVRNFPLVPGVDAAGRVQRSESSHWKAGDAVIVTGYGMGMSHWGGWSECLRVPSDWVVQLPDNLTTREAMIYGTAGFTAAQCLEALQRWGLPENAGAKVLVTGASGGVGSMAVALLHQVGCEVTAVSGKTDKHDWLKSIGAAETLTREQFMDKPPKPLLAGRFDGAIDSVGGTMLATLLKEIKPRGVVAACGLAGGPELETTVYPFILRAITLVGIDSAELPAEPRHTIWQRLAGPWKLPDLEQWANEETLDSVLDCVQPILRGELAGRHIVKVRDG